MKTVRTPKQKRSVEKKLKIIEKGFELMCDNGYYKTNTNDIAKYANVSTGIIYQYFTDKKDIFILYVIDVMLFCMNIIIIDYILKNNL